MKSLKIIETPHQGPVREWILYDKNHLIEVATDAMVRSDYEGELDDLDAYLDWLRSDLSRLQVLGIDEDDE